jgi:hypothetical protein
VARPIELTDDLSVEIARHLIDGSSIADACALVCIGERTYHDWVARGDAGEEPFLQFSQLTRAARAEGRQHHVKAIRSAVAGDWKAAAWFLERSDPANWGRQDRPPEIPPASDDDFEIDLGD